MTEPEIESWLVANRVTAKPYGQSESPAHYLQFNCPRHPLAVAAFIRKFLKPATDEILVHITDWPTYEQSEMIVIDALRRQSNEMRHLIDAPGHLIPAREQDLAVAIFGHSAIFEWNAYMYFPNDMATLYNWEGEIFDFWSSNSGTHEKIANLVGDFRST